MDEEEYKSKVVDALIKYKDMRQGEAIRALNSSTFLEVFKRHPDRVMAEEPKKWTESIKLEWDVKKNGN